MDDPSLDVPYGPYSIQKIGTVSIPRELQELIGIGAGAKVHWFLNPDMPGTLMLVPSVLVAQVTFGTREQMRAKRS